MKCKACNGTGKIKVIDFAKQDWKDTEKVCTICCGTGIIKQTNEEWFCELSTEEKAKWLENKMTWAAQEQGTFTAKGWEMWLKQPHREE